MRKRKKKYLKYNEIDTKNIKHLSVIMDGNGRWAKKQGLPRTAGHSAGVEKAREIVLFTKELKIPYLSLYTFSKENWKRSMDEVSFLMNLIVSHFEKEFQFYIDNRIKIIHLGDKNGLPEKVLNAIYKVEEDTKNFDSITLLLAINYSGKYDIIQAVNRIIKDGVNGEITEDIFKNYLLTKDIPDPDLIIRTGNEFRISNYFLWQAAYTEFYISDKNWPDFTKEDMIEAINNYNNRERRFGGVK